MKCHHCKGTGQLPDPTTPGGSWRARREGAGLSLRQLSKASGVSVNMIFRLENDSNMREVTRERVVDLIGKALFKVEMIFRAKENTGVR